MLPEPLRHFLGVCSLEDMIHLCLEVFHVCL